MNTKQPISYMTFTNPVEANAEVMKFITTCYPHNKVPNPEQHDETGPFLCLGNTLLLNIEHGDDYSTMLSSYATKAGTTIGSTVFRSLSNAKRNEMFVDDEESGIYTKNATKHLEEELLRVAKENSMPDGERALRMAYLGRCLRVMAMPWVAVQSASYSTESIELRVGSLEHVDQKVQAAMDEMLGEANVQQQFTISYLF